MYNMYKNKFVYKKEYLYKNVLPSTSLFVEKDLDDPLEATGEGTGEGSGDTLQWP